MMQGNGMRRSVRTAAVAGAALATAVFGFTGPAQAAPVDDGAYFQIKPEHTRGNTCLDVANISTAHGADVLQGSCWNGPNQQWRIQWVTGGYFEIKAQHSGKCLDVAYASTAHGANVIQADCRGRANQLWRFVVETAGSPRTVGRPAVNQFVQIRPMHSSSMCLDVANLSIAHGADVVQGGCWNGPNQRWRFVLPGQL
ncbi:RICIN domain-containing protein [Streptomyces sp. NPDC007369]|uniref:RICIN domain-containing protein n=1 Tax=Streptomyces sp. NPDC007369 TaxID=3154589 RepID=UPI0033F3A3AB